VVKQLFFFAKDVNVVRFISSVKPANFQLSLDCFFNFRQIRLLWFTLMREYRKCGDRDSVDVSSEAERKRRQKDTKYPSYWQKRVNAEECTAAFLTAIATLIKDASEITLVLYVIVGHGEQESVIGQFSLFILMCPNLLLNARRPYSRRVFVNYCSQIMYK